MVDDSSLNDTGQPAGRPRAAATGVRIVPLVAVWACLLGVVLQMHRLPGDWGHICGRWGCGPPGKALIVWHLFTMTFVALPAVLAAVWMSADALRRLGRVLTLIGGCGLLLLAVWEACHWFPHATDLSPWFFAARYLFVIATTTDVPIVALMSAACCLWIVGRRRCRDIGPTVLRSIGSG